MVRIITGEPTTVSVEFVSIFDYLLYDAGLIPTSQRVEGSPGYQDHSTGNHAFQCRRGLHTMSPDN